MFAKKFKRLERSKPNILAQTPSGAQMNKRDPGMLRVPHDRRNCANDEKSEQPIQTRFFEFLPKSRREEENQENANDFEGVRKSTQESKADQQSSQRPPKRKARALFNREPKSKHRRHPKEDRQR